MIQNNKNNKNIMLLAKLRSSLITIQEKESMFRRCLLVLLWICIKDLLQIFHESNNNSNNNNQNNNNNNTKGIYELKTILSSISYHIEDLIQWFIMQLKLTSEIDEKEITFSELSMTSAPLTSTAPINLVLPPSCNSQVNLTFELIG